MSGSSNQQGAFGRVGLFKDRQATTAPGVTDDINRGYTVGSQWTLTGVSPAVYFCVDNTAGAAVWMVMQGPGEGAIATLIGANMNSTADQAFTWRLPTGTAFFPTYIVATNASTSLTTAVGGIYSAASKGGTAVVAAAQAYSALTTSTVALRLTIAAAGLAASFTSLLLSLTTAQGGAATADIYLYGAIKL